MTRTTKEVRALVRDAENAGLRVQLKGDRWHVTNPHTNGQTFLPLLVTGRAMDNYRAVLRRLATPPGPMAAAVNTPNTEEDPVAWPVEELLQQAQQQGVRVHVSGGLLQVVGPAEAEPLARLVRDREPEVVAHLNPPAEKETAPVPKVRDEFLSNPALGTPAPRRTPTPADIAARKPRTTKPAPAPAVAPTASDAVTMLQTIAKRVADAERRADEAELLVGELEAENERLRGERDRYKAELDQINQAFRVLAGGAS